MSGAGASSIPAAPRGIYHASCVALSPSAGVLITGPSGSGKSTLALALMALGATLVSDDQTCLRVDAAHGTLVATAPSTIKGQIEARGMGILAADTFEQCQVRVVVDLSQCEEDRLPLLRKQSVIGVSIPLLYKVDGPQFAPALIQWLKGGRIA